MTLKEISFTNSAGHALLGIIRYSEPVEPVKYPVVIFLHGFAEHKHHDLTADLANAFVHYGFLTLRFDFHGHGESEGEFEEHTIEQQVDDVKCAIDFISDFKFADADRIAVVGTDIGGNIALLATAKDKRIRTVIAQGARSHFEHHLKSWFQPHDLKALLTTGFHEHHNFKLKKDYVENARTFDVLEEIKNIYVPVLFIHGNDDLRVKIEETRQLFLAANEPKALEEVEGADHWFRDNNTRTKLVELVVEWIKTAKT
jgi:dipeptidyl aminopeptidase/acylaminoacyl peptidase